MNLSKKWLSQCLEQKLCHKKTVALLIGLRLYKENRK